MPVNLKLRPARPGRRAATARRYRAWSAEASRDRLSSTTFLAALLHGVVILGITFKADPVNPDDSMPTSLEVVLVTRDYERIAPPAEARMLAQQNLIGHGNAPLDVQLRTSVTAPLPPMEQGPDQTGRGVADHPKGNPLPARPVLTTAAAANERVLPDRNGAIEQAAMRSQLPTGSAAVIDVLAEPDTVNQIPDPNPRELLVSASTREARVATYLNNWKSRVERIGTLNFPHAAELRRSKKHPVLEVAIAANGDLREVVVRDSSGFRNLDQAAVAILRIAAPFEPFPKALHENYDVLRFAYEWHFTHGVAAGRVTTIANAAAPGGS